MAMAMGKVSGIGRKLVRTKMESAKKEIRNALVAFKSKVWNYFRFFNQEGKTDMDMTHVICNIAIYLIAILSIS